MIKKALIKSLFVIILCATPLLMTQIPNILRSVFGMFHDEHCVLNDRIVRALESGDFKLAQKSIEKLQGFENKHGNTISSSHSTIGKAEYYQALLYEYQGELQKALMLRLKYRDEFRDIRGPRFYIDYYAIPRLYSKLNKQGEAFIEFCNVTRAIQDAKLLDFTSYTTYDWQWATHSFSECQTDKEVKKLHRICLSISDRLTYNPPINNNPQRYVSFPEFLKFAEEEYAKLGEPEEYADAMTVFRTINATLYEQSAKAENPETPGQAELQ